jgi:hypothetical protein
MNALGMAVTTLLLKSRMTSTVNQEKGETAGQVVPGRTPTGNFTEELQKSESCSVPGLVIMICSCSLQLILIQQWVISFPS